MILEWVTVVVWVAFLASLASITAVGQKEKHERLKARLNYITTFWFLSGIVLLVILAFVYLQELFLIAVFVLIFVTAFTRKYIFTKETPISAPDAPLPEKILSQIGSLAEYGNRIMALNFVVPLILLTLAYASGLTIQAQAALEASSDSLLVSSGLLIIIVTFTIFTFERNFERDIHPEITKRLTHRFKGLGMIYVLTILLSVLSLVLMTNQQLTVIPPSPLRTLLFLGVIYFLFVSITLTLGVYFQIAKVYEQGAQE
jgi:hypothetical protein